MVDQWVSLKLEEKFSDSRLSATDKNKTTTSGGGGKTSDGEDETQRRRHHRSRHETSGDIRASARRNRKPEEAIDDEDYYGEERRSRHRRRRSRSRSRSRDRHEHRSKGTGRPKSPPSSSLDTRDSENAVLSPEDRDVRTVMVSNLSNKASERDLKEILRSCGKIRNCKIIRDSHTNRSKGIAYVEFYDIEPVNKACDLTGKKLLGHSMIIETSQAEKNREYAAHSASQKAVQSVGGKQVRIENLHKEITSANLRDIFSHFGTITNCQITPDKSSVNNTNLAFLTFSTAANARAMATSLDGFELVNLKLRITQLTDTSSHSHRSVLDSDIVDRGGVNLGKIGRFELMAKLAEGSGLRVPNIKANSSTGIGQNKQTAGLSTPTSTGGSSVKSMTSQCIVISNFFDSTKKELSDSEIRTIKDEVISVINNSGGCFHVSVDRKSIDGNVFAKCQTVGSAASAYQAFNGKTYNGRQLSAIYLPIASYHELFPESAHSFSLLSCSSPKSLPSNA